MDFVLYEEVRGLQNRINPMLLIGRVVMTKDLVTEQEGIFCGVFLKLTKISATQQSPAHSWGHLANGNQIESEIMFVGQINNSVGLPSLCFPNTCMQ